MINLHSILAVLSMAFVLNQPVLAANEFESKEMMQCVPVGEMAQKISKLQKLGYKRKFIETSLEKQLDENMYLWITPISKLIFSKIDQSSEKVVKQAIGYCLNTIKMHRNGHITKKIEV